MALVTIEFRRGWRDTAGAVRVRQRITVDGFAVAVSEGNRLKCCNGKDIRLAAFD